MGESEPPAANTPGGGDTPKALSPARYLAWLYSTDAQKTALAALLEIEAEIGSGLRPGIEHHVAHARLQWWSEEAERVAQGRPVHPLAKELVKAHARGGGISGLVDTAVWDLARATFETRKELTAYCERWATAMFETAASAHDSTSPPARDRTPGTRLATRDPVLGAGITASDLVRGATPETVRMAAPDGSTAAPATVGMAAPDGSTAAPATVGMVAPDGPTDAPAAAGMAAPGEAAPSPSPWKTLGAAVREIELLARAASDAHAGRVRMPLDELDGVGVDPNALAKLPWPAPLTALLKERHQALRATLANSVATLAREEQMRLRGLLVWVTLTWRLSVRAEHALPNVILPRRYDALADGWQAWRAARRAASGKLRLV
jgi:phytoene/squalene synthetase